MEKKIYQKWWFWLIILGIVIILSISTILLYALSSVTSGLSGVAMDVQSVYKDATLYGSAGENTLILELEHLTEDSIPTINYTEIFRPIRKAIENKELSTYTKLIILGYVDYETDENIEIIKLEYSLPNFTEIGSYEYIDREYFTSAISNAIYEGLTSY